MQIPKVKAMTIVVFLAVALATTYLTYGLLNPGTPDKFYLSVSEASCAPGVGSYYITVRNMDTVENVSLSQVAFTVDDAPVNHTWLQYPSTNGDDVIGPKSASFVSIPCSNVGEEGQVSCVRGTTHKVVIVGPNRDKQVLVAC